MKRCSWCTGDVQDTDQACSHCGMRLDAPPPDAWADDEIASHAGLPFDDAAGRAGTPAAAPQTAAAPQQPDAPAPPPSAAAQAQAHARGLNRTELVIVLLSIVAGGVVTFGVLMARGASTQAAAPPMPIESSAAAAAIVPAPDTPAAPKWSSANRSRWVRNPRRDVALELPAENKVQAWMTQVEPVLVVRCMGRRTEAFVYTGTPAKIEPQDEDHTVGIAFDTGPQSAERWPDSAEHDALFAPDGEAFARRLMAAGTLRFGFTPHNAAPVTVHFDVRGLEERLGPAAARQCGWKK